jgi:rubrerythrin
MYPAFLEISQEEGQKTAEISFKNAMAVEKIHHGLYQKALEAVKAGSDLPQKNIFICGVCGNTVYDAAPDKCPVCGASKEKFSEMV